MKNNAPQLKDYPHNFTVALEFLLLSQLFIFRTIFQPWTLSFDTPAPKRGLFTKYQSPNTLSWTSSHTNDQFTVGNLGAQLLEH